MYDELHHLNSPLLYGGSNPNIAETASTYGGQEYTPPLHTNPSVPTQVPTPTTTSDAPHMGGSTEVTVESPEKKIVSTESHLISPAPPSQPINKPKYNASYGFGTAQTGYQSYDTARKNAIAHENPNVYREDLVTATGVHIPTGSTGQAPAERLAHVSGATGQTAASMIGQEGSIQDIQQASQYAPIPTTPDVQQAVNQTQSAGLPKTNLAPKKKGH